MQAKLDMLTSAGMKMDSYRAARAYDLWQLAELAHDDACRAAIMGSGGDIIPTLVMLLQESHAPAVQAATAVLVRRLSANSPGNGRELSNSGTIPCPVLYSPLHVPATDRPASC